MGFYIWTVCIHATNRATAPVVWIPKMWGLQEAMDGAHTSLDILLKHDQNNKDDIILVKDNLKFIFNQI